MPLEAARRQSVSLPTRRGWHPVRWQAAQRQAIAGLPGWLPAAAWGHGALRAESAGQLTADTVATESRPTDLACVTWMDLTKLVLRRLWLAELSLTELLAKLVAARSVLVRAALAEWDLASAVGSRVAGLTQWAAVVGTALVKPDALLMPMLPHRTAALLCAEPGLVIARLDANRRLATCCFWMLVLRRLRTRA
jgi:hypothetical protein